MKKREGGVITGMLLLVFVSVIIHSYGGVVRGQNQYFTSRQFTISPTGTKGSNPLIKFDVDFKVCRIVWKHSSGSIECERGQRNSFGCSTYPAAEIVYAYLDHSPLLPYKVNGKQTQTITVCNSRFIVATQNDQLYKKNTIDTSLNSILVPKEKGLQFATLECADITGDVTVIVDLYQCDQTPPLPILPRPAMRTKYCLLGNASGIEIDSSINVCAARLVYREGNHTCQSFIKQTPFFCGSLDVWTYLYTKPENCVKNCVNQIYYPITVNGYPSSTSTSSSSYDSCKNPAVSRISKISDIQPISASTLIFEYKPSSFQLKAGDKLFVGYWDTIAGCRVQSEEVCLELELFPCASASPSASPSSTIIAQSLTHDLPLSTRSSTNITSSITTKRTKSPPPSAGSTVSQSLLVSRTNIEQQTTAPVQTSEAAIASQLQQNAKESNAIHHLNSNSGIQESSHTITPEDAKNGVTIPIQSSVDGNPLVGALTIPKGVLPEGAIVMVNQSQADMDFDDGCNGESKTVIASPRVDITVVGGPNEFSEEVELQMLVQMPSSHSKDSTICIAFTQHQEKTKDWSCLDGSPNVNWTSDGVGVLSQKTNHFTSFAALFRSTESPSQCGWDNWIWIACLIATGIALTCWILVVLLTIHSKRFRRLITGVDQEELSLTKLNKAVIAASKKTTATVV